MNKSTNRNGYALEPYISKNELKNKYSSLLREYAATRLLLGIAIQRFGSGLMMVDSDKTITISKEEYEKSFAGKKFDIHIDTESEEDKIKVTMKFYPQDFADKVISTPDKVVDKQIQPS